MITSGIEFIWPQMAAEMLENNLKNRKVSQNVVDLFARDMANGEWELNGESIKFDKNGRLIDGQHRLLAIIKAGVSVQTFVVRGLNPETIYTQDTGRRRSLKDAFDVEGIKYSNLIPGIIKSHNSLQLSGHNYVRESESIMNKGARSLTNKEALAIYHQDPETWDHIAAFTSAVCAHMSLLKTSELGGIYAYLYKNLGYSMPTIEQFFNELTDAKPTSNNTIRLLRKRLLDAKLHPRDTLVPRYRFAIIVRTWNAYINGENLRVLRWDFETQGIPTFQENKAEVQTLFVNEPVKAKKPAKVKAKV